MFNTIKLPKPEEIRPDLPKGVRVVYLLRFVIKLREHLEEKIVISNNFRGDKYLTAFTAKLEYIQLAEQPYRDLEQKLNTELSSKLDKAQLFESKGEISQALMIYEELAKDGFSPYLPYERLRIIYTRQKQYEKAIEACKRYIEILDMVKEINPKYPNISYIPKYQEWIKKLNAQIKAKT